MRRVESKSNPLLRELLRLGGSARQRRKSGRILLDGPHLLAAALDHGHFPEAVVVSERGSTAPEIVALAQRCAGADVVRVPDALFAALATVDTPSGVLAMAAMPPPRVAGDEVTGVLLLEGLQDPGNVGTVLRTAAAAGGWEVMLSPGCADVWSPRALRAGMGAQFGLAMCEGADPIAAVQAFDGTVVATDPRAGRSVFETPLVGRIALVFGSEGAGLTPALARLCQLSVAIPMAPGAESLNVAAAAAVVLFERVRQAGTGGSRPRGQLNRPA